MQRMTIVAVAAMLVAAPAYGQGTAPATAAAPHPAPAGSAPQVRHGLAATGTVTPRTLAALNVSVHKRIKQLEASLERLGQMNFPFGQRYVVVNIPAAFAEAIEDDKVMRRYRVIVGKTEKPSPTLVADITSVNLNPTWTVPSSIAKAEISAHMRKDQNYLSRMHMEVLGAQDAPLDPHAVDSAGAHPP